MTTAVIHRPLAEVPFVTVAGAAQGQDCFSQVIALLNLRPDWRAMVGSLLVYCKDAASCAEGAWYWQRPWMQHCWLVDPDGTLHDPALRNLDTWGDGEITLPAPALELTARSAGTFEEGQALVQALMGQALSLEPQPQETPLVYAPGCIFSTPFDLKKAPEHFWLTWAAVAGQSLKAGGFTQEQLLMALAWAEKAERGSAPTKAKGRGFGHG